MVTHTPNLRPLINRRICNITLSFSSNPTILFFLNLFVSLCLCVRPSPRLCVFARDRLQLRPLVFSPAHGHDLQQSAEPIEELRISEPLPFANKPLVLPGEW